MKRKYVKVTPETYRKYRPCFEPYKGDIVAFESNIYIDFPGGTWQDHFTKKNDPCNLRRHRTEQQRTI